MRSFAGLSPAGYRHLRSQASRPLRHILFFKLLLLYLRMCNINIYPEWNHSSSFDCYLRTSTSPSFLEPLRHFLFNFTSTVYINYLIHNTSLRGMRSFTGLSPAGPRHDSSESATASSKPNFLTTQAFSN